VSKLTPFAAVPYNGSVAVVRACDMRGWPSGWASAFQADLHGFDSRTPLFRCAALGRSSKAGVAQLVEHLICNQRVGGSSPSASSKKSITYVEGR
jgi:hypothetical protein